jgi:hypothetical protein
VKDGDNSDAKIEDLKEMLRNGKPIYTRLNKALNLYYYIGIHPLREEVENDSDTAR